MTDVRYLMPRDVDGSVFYQRYYLLGLEVVARVQVEGGPSLARVVPGPQNKLRALYRARRLRRAVRPVGHVGRYEAEADGRRVRFAIDAHDAHAVRDEQALAWSDVYFKANRWPAEAYDAKVAPIVNGNGLLDRRRLRTLLGLRGADRDVDVSFVTRMHGGRPHLLRIFEALAALQCTKDLLAIFPRGFPDDAAYRDRLWELGVSCTSAELTPAELWSRLARAKVVVMRSGRHLCMSWRMIDLLAMGACIVYDAAPLPQWPVPLLAGEQYADGGIRRPLDGTAAPGEDYAGFSRCLERLLLRPAEAEALRQGAAAYFDDHAAPERVAEYVLDRIGAGRMARS